MFKSLLYMIMSCDFLRPKNFPFSKYLRCTADIAAEETNLMSLVMTQRWTEIRTYRLPDNGRMSYL